MKNDECIIYIYHNDKLVNTWYKEGDKWILISTRGIFHYATAEQFLSHLLPSLLKDDFTVIVKLRDQNEDTRARRLLPWMEFFQRGRGVVFG